MTRQQYTEQVFNVVLERLQKLSVTKGDEYAITSFSHNFDRGSELSRTTRTPIQVLEGMQLKHTVSISDILDLADQVYNAKMTSNLSVPKIRYTKEQILEKFCDSLTYDILKLGLVLEELDLIEDDENNIGKGKREN